MLNASLALTEIKEEYGIPQSSRYPFYVIELMQ
jgi:hypothetical protein